MSLKFRRDASLKFPECIGMNQQHRGISIEPYKSVFESLNRFVQTISNDEFKKITFYLMPNLNLVLDDRFSTFDIYWNGSDIFAVDTKDYEYVCVLKD